jgi:germacradienol/geosmin synthase
MRSSRYMNGQAAADPGALPAAGRRPVLGGPAGLGTAAARVTPAPGSLGRIRSHSHVPYQAVGPVTLPSFQMPFPARVSPHLDAARRHVMAWAERMGMLAPAPGVPGSGVWDARKLAAFDFALCAAMIDPDGSGTDVELSSGWLTWGTYADDYVPAVFGRRRDLAGAKAFNDRLPAFMPVGGATTAVPANPVERGLADLWERTAATMPEGARRRFRRAVEDMTTSWLWELANHVQHRIPDPIDYVEMRRKTFGSDLTMSLARLSRELEVPPAVFEARQLRGLENAASDFAALANDVFSYQKEVRFEGELNNGVLVAQRFLGCDLPTAVAVVNDLMTARVRRFQHIAATELPVLYDELDLDARARGALDAHVGELRDWMAAVLEWHRSTRRYDEAELRRPPAAATTSPRPTGLGTSAARLAAAPGVTSTRGT